MSNDFESEIKSMVSDIIEVPVEDLTLEADFFNDLSVDSLKAIEIVAACEKKYKIVIPENDIPNIRNIAQIIEYLSNRKND